jgi:hypothetical protein
MTVELRRLLPRDNERARREIYGGAIYKLPSTAASIRLVEQARDLLRNVLKVDEIRLAKDMLSADVFFEAIGRARKVLFMESQFHAAVRSVIAAVGFDPEGIAFDPVRLRVINHLGHEDPRAAPVYYPHRDTWYAHSQSLIAWGIPLDDLAAEETFEFYPNHLETPVENGSGQFEYKAWVKDGWDLKIGWQNKDAGLTAVYPQAAECPPAGSGVGFSCRRGENLLFAGAHFHRTLPQQTGRTRFSLDFRIAHLGDHERGIGAPNVDNQSRGSALVDYVKPGPLETQQ